MSLLILDALLNLLQWLNILVDLANTIYAPVKEEYWNTKDDIPLGFENLYNEQLKLKQREIKQP